jgi:mannose-1-phosphate guanylyltransferase/mannose-1-phosphate guanylyltransferase/mannose-6-phosphate isomerase
LISAYAATGFGYIQTSDTKILTLFDAVGFPVLKFHEKPNEPTAQSFLQQGHFFWNAGIFIFQVQVMKLLLQKYQPKLWSQIVKVKGDLSNLMEVYSEIESISIDYAIMEKLSSEELCCVPSEMGWNDIGSWDAVAELSRNTQKMPCLVSNEAIGNYVMPHADKTYALSGVNDLLVIDTADALLISRKGTSQDVKFLVNQLRESNPKVLDEHIFEERPWGSYEVLKNTDYFKSKIIKVDVGGQLSYQSHNKREEHWIIVKGEGDLCLNGDIIKVKVGSNITIPCGAKHRIKNTGTQSLEFIEVQIGSYFGEDDITRYQDDYNRSSSI